MPGVRTTCKQEIIWLSEMESKKEAAEGEGPDTEPTFDRFQRVKDRAAAAVHLKKGKSAVHKHPYWTGAELFMFAGCDLYSGRGSTDLSCGTANQYSCFLPCWAYCCMEALALETKVFFMGFPTRRHRNLWERGCFVSAQPVPGRASQNLLNLTNSTEPIQKNERKFNQQ